MSKQKPNTSLADLVPTRTAPRSAPVEMVAAEVQEASTRRRQPSRAKTVMIAGHFDPDVSFAMRELCGKLTRQQGKRVTMQEAIAEGLALWFEKHGAEMPDGLRPGSQ